NLNLLEGAVIHVEPGSGCSFGRHNAIEVHPVLTLHSERAIGSLRSHRRAADVRTCNDDTGGLGQNDPDVASVRYFAQHVLIEIDTETRVLNINNWRLTAHCDCRGHCSDLYVDGPRRCHTDLRNDGVPEQRFEAR